MTSTVAWIRAGSRGGVVHQDSALKTACVPTRSCSSKSAMAHRSSRPRLATLAAHVNVGERHQQEAHRSGAADVFTASSGCKISYRDIWPRSGNCAAAPTILFVPGVGSRSDTFDRHLTELSSEGFRCVAIDNRGVGEIEVLRLDF
eukprot:SAG31_NODE_21_length_34109_cov_60.598824_23_plen_146_part_00